MSRNNHATPLASLAMQWELPALALVALAFTSACSSGGADELEITVEIDGDVITIGWDEPRPVHALEVLTAGGPFSFAWYISEWEERSIPNTPATIVPPIVYGSDVAGTFTHAGPDALVKGTTYRIYVSQRGWGEACNEQGIPVDTATSECGLAKGELLFTF